MVMALRPAPRWCPPCVLVPPRGRFLGRWFGRRPAAQARAGATRAPDAPSAGAVAATADVLKAMMARDGTRGASKGGVCVLLGAGASASAGLPDFRTPGTGLYDNLASYNLPYPEAIFELDFYRREPEPFNLLARTLYPGTVPPTKMHRFIALLAELGLLTRCFTQNIDSLEREAGVPGDLVVPCHGNFDAAACIECGAPADPEEVRESLCAGDGPLQPTCRRCGGKVKPSIVFFGEALPERFFALAPEVRDCRLLLVAGTSLQVHPVASLPTLASPSRALRVLANMELVGAELGFKFGEATDELCGDVAFVGACDAFAEAVAREAFGVQDL